MADTQRVDWIVGESTMVSLDGKDLVVSSSFGYFEIKLSPLAQWNLIGILQSVDLERSRFLADGKAKLVLDDMGLVRFLGSRKEEQQKTIDDLRSLAAEMNATLSTIRFNEPYRISSTVTATVDVDFHVKLVSYRNSIKLWSDEQKDLANILNVVAPVDEPEEEAEKVDIVETDKKTGLDVLLTKMFEKLFW